jgi:hypothetical protein
LKDTQIPALLAVNLMAQTGTNRTRADRDEPDVGQGDGEREPGQAQKMPENGTLKIEDGTLSPSQPSYHPLTI